MGPLAVLAIAATFSTDTVVNLKEYLSALKHASTIAFASLKFVSSVLPLSKSESSISIPH